MNTKLNTENRKNDWSDLKAKIKARFGKLTDESVDSAKENLDILVGKLQNAYGYAKEQAEKELSGFKHSLKDVPEGKQEESRVEKVAEEKSPTAERKVS